MEFRGDAERRPRKEKGEWGIGRGWDLGRKGEGHTTPRSKVLVDNVPIAAYRSRK